MTATEVTGSVPEVDDPHPEVPWRRLDRRLIWMNLTKGVLSLVPTGFGVVVLQVKVDSLLLWPLLLTTLTVLATAIKDVVRWNLTWYRVTAERVERRSGLLVRQYRSVPRDRIRSVSTTAKLRHQAFGLRVVMIAAGQSATEGKSAVSLDAVTRSAAERLRRELTAGERVTSEEGAADGAASPAEPDEHLIARVEWWWVFYNILSVWGFIFAGVMCWVLFWFVANFGVDLRDVIGDGLREADLGTAGTITVSLLGLALLGVIGLSMIFVAENWRFRLVRTITEQGPTLSTTQGLLRTREVHRDESRIRGVRISEPLIWRWMRLAETELISTGLATWNLAETSANMLLPRSPVREARRVATAVLNDEARPFDVPLRSHPPAALRRRAVWGVNVTAAVTGALAWLGVTGAVPPGLWLWALVLLPVTVVLAVVAYRALGHVVAGDYLVTRRGLLNRSTAAVQHRTVTGWSMRQSVLQRRLGLISIGASTAAGAGTYKATDVRTTDGIALVHGLAPDLLAPFVRPVRPTTPSGTGATPPAGS